MDMSQMRLQGSNILEMKKSLNYSGVGTQSDRIDLPPVRAKYIVVHGSYTVTDAGISAGENFSGCLSELWVGEGGNTPLHVKTDEVVDLLAFQWREVVTGKYQDSTPTTQVAQNFGYVFKGPFNLRSMARPELFLSLRAITAEFGAASAFAANVYVTIVTEDDQDGLGLYFHRDYRPSAIRHDIDLGPGFVNDILVINSNASKISIEDQRGVAAITFDRLFGEQLLWTAQTSQAADTDAYLIEDIDIPELSSTRSLIVENSSAATCTVFTLSVVQG